MKPVDPAVSLDEMKEQHFLAHYSYYLHIMKERLFSRLGKVLTFSQLVLGSSVLASTSYSVPVGLLLVSCTAIQLSCRPDTAAYQSKNQAAKYKALHAKLLRLTAEAIRKQVHAIEETDSPELGTLCLPAYWRTCIRPDRVDLNQRMETLSRWQKIIAWLAGDLPTKPSHFLTQYPSSP